MKTSPPELASHVMPIQSFIGATVPLDKDTGVLPGGEAVDDSRFVVRYFRKSKDNRLLFGGREAYGKSRPDDIEKAIRRQITEIYPQLTTTEITHAWGGNVAITMPRLPYVRELQPGLWTAGGFSGHGGDDVKFYRPHDRRTFCWQKRSDRTSQRVENLRISRRNTVSPSAQDTGIDLVCHAGSDLTLSDYT